MKKTHREIQDEVIKRYRIDLCDGSKCKDDHCRTHAHLKGRRVCKWKQASSVLSTFTLLHEIGHIEANHSRMRRCEQEYYATAWALERCKDYGVWVPKALIWRYQRYIDREHDRGLRRGGQGYADIYDIICYEWDEETVAYVNKKEVAK